MQELFVECVQNMSEIYYVTKIIMTEKKLIHYSVSFSQKKYTSNF